jgi:hypothetical protein
MTITHDRIFKSGAPPPGVGADREQVAHDCRLSTGTQTELFYRLYVVDVSRG